MMVLPAQAMGAADAATDRPTEELHSGIPGAYSGRITHPGHASGIETMLDKWRAFLA
jgi:hypothetical protein